MDAAGATTGDLRRFSSFFEAFRRLRGPKREDTVAEIKAFVHEKMSIPGEQMLFICRGRRGQVMCTVDIALNSCRIYTRWI